MYKCGKGRAKGRTKDAIHDYQCPFSPLTFFSFLPFPFVAPTLVPSRKKHRLPLVDHYYFALSLTTLKSIQRILLFSPKSSSPPPPPTPTFFSFSVQYALLFLLNTKRHLLPLLTRHTLSLRHYHHRCSNNTISRLQRRQKKQLPKHA